ncbi:MAG: hypothetical protein ABIO56_19805 [Ferruginibacter sp.]
MKRNISIKLKAALLLIVFSMNTILGFACAMGVDMGFNTHHHDEEEVPQTTIHVHAESSKDHHHDETVKHHHDSKEESEKGGCCNDGVMKFQHLDKNLAQNGNAAINIPAFVAMLSSFFGTDIFKQPQASAPKYIVRFFHPPPPDIRILIQSFQI